VRRATGGGRADSPVTLRAPHPVERAAEVGAVRVMSIRGTPVTTTPLSLARATSLARKPRFTTTANGTPEWRWDFSGQPDQKWTLDGG